MEIKKLKKFKVNKWQNVILAVLALAIILSACAIGFKAGNFAFAFSGGTFYCEDWLITSLKDVNGETVLQAGIGAQEPTLTNAEDGHQNEFVVEIYYRYGEKTYTSDNDINNDIGIGHLQLAEKIVRSGPFTSAENDCMYNIDTAISSGKIKRNDNFNDITLVVAFKRKIYNPQVVDPVRQDIGYSNGIKYTFKPLNAVELPEEPTKPGHTFSGWYYDVALTQPYKDGDVIIADTTLYAKFTVNNYDVKYYVNGELVDTKTVQYGGKAANLALTEAGYTYSAWCVDQATSSGYDFDTNTVSDNLNLYATKAVIMLKVTFLVDGTTYRVLDVPYGSALISVLKATAAGDIIDNVQIFNAQTQTYDAATADTLVVSDITAQAHVIDGLEGWLKFGNWLNHYWLWLIIGIASAIILSVIIVVIYKKA